MNSSEINPETDPKINPEMELDQQNEKKHKVYNVLIIGSGGREHAIARHISSSQLLDKLYATPGNPGIAEYAECHNLSQDKIKEFTKKNNISIVIIGPEKPLVDGLADELRTEGIYVLGPGKKGAMFEGSKSFARKFMKKYGLPSAEFEEFTDLEKAKSYIEKKGAPIVIKADGLAAGKGVCVAQSVEEAIEFSEKCLIKKKFGKSSAKILVEECLIGEEASYHIFTDGESFIPMASSKDHKPVFDGNKGPNTGGMGAFSPGPIGKYEDIIGNDIVMPFLDGIKQEGISYSGVLYIGLMKTNQGPKIVEFNCRFGDPETQVILPRLETDLITIIKNIENKSLDKITLDWNDNATVCVVACSEGYPGEYEKNKEIIGIKKNGSNIDNKNNTDNNCKNKIDYDDKNINNTDYNDKIYNINNVDKIDDDNKNNDDKAYVIFAGIKEEDGKLLTNGGRVLGVVAKAKDIASSRAKVYDKIKGISFEGMHYRKDIGEK